MGGLAARLRVVGPDDGSADGEQVNIRLTIEVDGARLLELCGDSAVLPTMESERAAAFAMLSDALALLAGLAPSRMATVNHFSPAQR